VLVLVAVGLAGLGAGALANPPADWPVVVICGLLVAFLVWFLVAALRRAPGRIVLTVDGVVHRSLRFEHFVPWFAVRDVVAQPGTTPLLVVKAFPSDGTRARRWTGRLGAYELQFLPFVVARTYWLGARAVPAYPALGFYLRHAERRTDLQPPVR
jgi:hypothetical protein